MKRTKSLKDKDLVHTALTPYAVKVKAFYYQDVKEAVLGFEEVIKEDTELLKLYKAVFGEFKT